ncbi:hypothetical protein B7C51_17665 [Paenibacillus larvae subsp. pulvifaciens]|uniref:Uncharacterized protein n=1 Tax=Paenibacillus larvae subsp. pulvifaciens TaxID=1477 RepID=A0A1V0UVM5_9BACL|nr:hypothetical protein B7C51_17665 [Paenibacillus larvae subsp. pulvifaciens]
MTDYHPRIPVIPKVSACGFSRGSLKYFVYNFESLQKKKGFFKVRILTVISLFYETDGDTVNLKELFKIPVVYVVLYIQI